MTLAEYLEVSHFNTPIQVYNLLADCKPFFYYSLEQPELIKKLETSEKYLRNFEVQHVLQTDDEIQIFV